MTDGILANSARKTMTDGAISGAVTGYLTAERVTLTRFPVVGVYSWSLVPPIGSRARISVATAASPWFLPDIEGTYTITVTTPGPVVYTLQVGVADGRALVKTTGVEFMPRVVVDTPDAQNGHRSLVLDENDLRLKLLDDEGNAEEIATPITARDRADVPLPQESTYQFKGVAVSHSTGRNVVDAGHVLVTEFPGVDPTGVADSTTGLQAAFDTIGDAGGGTLRVPPGEYAHSVPLFVPSGCTLEMSPGASFRNTSADVTANGSCLSLMLGNYESSDNNPQWLTGVAYTAGDRVTNDGQDYSFVLGAQLIATTANTTLWSCGHTAGVTSLRPAARMIVNGTNGIRIRKTDDANAQVIAGTAAADTNAHAFSFATAANGITASNWLDGTVQTNGGAYDVGATTLDQFALGCLYTLSTASQWCNAYGSAVACGAPDRSRRQSASSRKAGVFADRLHLRLSRLR
jgi:hypothetical protein